MRKVGDKIKIKNEITEDMFDYVEELQNYVGKEAIITEVDNERNQEVTYYLDVDDSYWSWHEDYFE